jgi:hypothetical protein
MRLNEWMSLQEAFEHVLQIVSPNTAARATMLTHLRDGSIPTRAENENGEQKDLGCDFWADPTEIVNPFGTAVAVRTPQLIGNIWQVYLGRSAVMKTWPLEEKTAAQKLAHTAKVIKRGGAPMKHDWVSLAAHIAAYVVENDLPKKQADLVREAERFFGNEQKLPDVGDLKAFIRQFYQSHSDLQERRKKNPPDG